MQATQARASIHERSDDGPSAEPVDPDPDQPLPAAADRRPTLDLSDPLGLIPRAALGALRSLGEHALAHIRPRDTAGEVRARIVNDEQMARLHLSTLGDPATTDVLTFDLADDPGLPLDADLVLCADEARRRASQIRVPVEHELLLYLIHGVLHCSGYDDLTDEQSHAIHTREDEILRAVGVGPIYSRVAGGEP